MLHCGNGDFVYHAEYIFKENERHLRGLAPLKS